MKVLIKKITLLLLIAATFATHGAVIRGGNSAGGGGSNLVDNYGMTSAGGMGDIIAAAEGSSIQTRLQDFIREKPSQVEVCPDDPSLAVVPLPDRMKNYFSIQIEPIEVVVRHFLGAKNPVMPLNLENICASKELHGAYSNLALALYQLENRTKKDGTAEYLFQQTVKLGGPIRLVVTPRRQTLAAVGGTLIESSWYEQGPDLVYFGPQNICKGFNCFGFRDESSVLVHEVGHSFLRRALQGAYPQANEWHDVRHLEKMDLDEGSHKLIESQTSATVAFVEALANSFEKRHFMQIHPFLISDISLYKMRKDGCYQPPQIALDKIFSTGNFTAPIESEVYVSSALNVLLNGWQASDEAVDGALNQNLNLLISSVSTQRQKAVIDGVVEARPTNIVELAKALDRQLQSDWGWRLVREYFFYDYKTKQSLGADYIRKPLDRNFQLGNVDSVALFCGPEKDYEKSLSYIGAQERENELIRAQSAHAQKVLSLDISKDIFQTLNENKIELQKIKDKTIRFDQVERILTNLTNEKNLCGQLDDPSEKLIHQVYRVAEKNGKIIPLWPLRSILSLKCPSTRSLALATEVDVQANLQLLQDGIYQSNRLALTDSEPGTNAHFSRVQSWLKLKKQMHTANQNLEMIVMSVSIAEELLK